MDTAVKPRAAKKPAAKERQDLRAWIAQLRAVGELQDINGAEREREIGGQYAGHAKQAGLIASQCHAGAYGNRFVVVVDDDIDPSDMDKVVWAMCTRFDPREGMETLRAQRACGNRRLQAVQTAGYFPGRGARQQGGRGSRSQ